MKVMLNVKQRSTKSCITPGSLVLVTKGADQKWPQCWV